MKNVDFPLANHTFAKDQAPYAPLRCHLTPDGIVTSCWRLTLFERLKVLFRGRVWLQMMAFNSAPQPVRLTVLPVVVDLSWPRKSK